ncbi:MAG: hypothetical protein ACKO2V_06715, partial [Snowella sp.]
MDKEKRDLLEKIRLLEMPRDAVIAQKERELADLQVEVSLAVRNAVFWREESICAAQLNYFYRLPYWTTDIQWLTLGEHRFDGEQFRCGSIKVGSGLQVKLEIAF